MIRWEKQQLLAKLAYVRGVLSSQPYGDYKGLKPTDGLSEYIYYLRNRIEELESKTRPNRVSRVYR